ncbi:MAG: long-chain fatty acid--CoA ligase [Deltaproteobacteria bacterium]|nr:long-chain fatty acid--CoA ligase [Deltaproteobacteria bacterium]
MAKSMYQLFTGTVHARKDKVAAQIKVNGAWRDITWGEMDKVGTAVAAGLVQLGVAPKEMVSIMSNTRIEWVQADVGVLGAGATTVPIYQSSIADDVQYILNDSGAVAVFVEDDAQLKKMRDIRSLVPKVRKVIAFTGTPKGDWETSWEQFLKDGEAFLKDNAATVASRAAGLGPDDVLTLIYTSGTTGRPKGAIITHDNMLYESEAAMKVGIAAAEHVQYLFLPMAHVFAKVLEACWFRTGHVMSFWEGDMKKIVDNLGEVRPTNMCAVPRIFEKVYAKVMSDVAATPGLAGRIASWGVAQGAAAAKAEQQGQQPRGMGWTLAQKLVWKKLHTKLTARFGGRMQFFVSGGAPLSRDIAFFFKHAGFKICEGYGLTETSAATCVNLPDKIKIGTVGRPLPGTELKIAADGEVLIRGRGVMKGYWNKPEATKEALEPDGWFHTGDIGEIDSEGFLKITDRKKDIIVTAGGKNVAPQNLENIIKAKSPLISQAVVHGDKRKFLSVLITVDEETVTKWAKDKGLPGAYSAITQSKELESEIGNVLKNVNAGLASYESLKKYKVLDHDFVVGDQLTPSLKVKRKVCNERYKDIFDGFYVGDASAD